MLEMILTFLGTNSAQIISLCAMMRLCPARLASLVVIVNNKRLAFDASTDFAGQIPIALSLPPERLKVSYSWVEPDAIFRKDEAPLLMDIFLQKLRVFAWLIATPIGVRAV
jgi:hypothetical protein